MCYPNLWQNVHLNHNYIRIYAPRNSFFEKFLKLLNYVCLSCKSIVSFCRRSEQVNECVELVLIHVHL